MKNLVISLSLIFPLFSVLSLESYCQITQASTKLEASSIYEKAAPSVVSITCIDAKGQVVGGSGVILRSDGIIATNFHVISGATAAKVQLSNSDIYDDVTIIDTDERKDIAILKIKAVSLPILSFADSDNIKIGATVYTIGSPRGLTGSLSSGLISSLRPASDLSPELTGFRIIQFTAPVSPGSSGGALLDDTGRLLGLVFAFKPGGQNLNVAIPVNYVVPLATNARNDGRSLKRMPIVGPSNTVAATSSSDSTGVYTGSWASNSYDVAGTLVMTVSKVDGQYQVKAVFTGSEYFNQDELIATLTDLGGGVWKMDYKGKKSKITGTGLFRGGRFVGDYKFKKWLWIDRGQWLLDK